jgi:hypothetical protein
MSVQNRGLTILNPMGSLSSDLPPAPTAYPTMPSNWLLPSTFIHIGAVRNLNDLVSGPVFHPNPDKILLMMQHLKGLGFTKVIVCWTYHRDPFAYNDYSPERWLPIGSFPGQDETPTNMYAVMAAIFDCAVHLNMKVTIGLGYCMDSIPDWATNINCRAGAAEAHRRMVLGFEQIFASNSIIDGYYLSNEPYTMWPPVSVAMDDEYSGANFTAALVKACRTVTNKPFYIAPYIASSLDLNKAAWKNPTPNVLSAWKTRIDRFKAITGTKPLVQDSLSIGDVSLIQHPNTADIYSITGDHADIELMTLGCGNLPAPINRLVQQCINAGPGSTSWIAADSMLPRDPCSKRLGAEWKAWAGIQNRLLPFTYTWYTKPANDYPDKNNDKLTSWYTPNPRNPNDNWVGVLATGVNGTIDFGKPVSLKWLSFQLLNYPAWGIFLPHTLELSFDEGENWIAYGLDPRAKSNDVGEFVFSNTEELNIRVDKVWFWLSNDLGWTFIGKVTATGQ